MRRNIIFAVIAFVITFAMCSMAAHCIAADTYIKDEYQEYCIEIGEQYGICPELLMAMIEAESSGNADAINGECKGLMQVAEKWHTARMKMLGVSNIYDPYGNILVAADYLLELFEKYEDVGMVLMVYNGDSGAQAYCNGSGQLSTYAQKILARSEMLERIHGK